MCGGIFKSPKYPKYTPTVTEAPAPTPSAPSATEISASNDSNALSDEINRNKKKRGYASTRTSTQVDTIASAAGGKKTLG